MVADGRPRRASQLPADAHVAASRAPELPPGATQEVTIPASAPGAVVRKASSISTMALRISHVTTSVFASETSAKPKTMKTNSSSSSRSLARRVRADSKGIADELIQIISFRGCEHLLRGSHLTVVMRNQAGILHDKNGSSATYVLSKAAKGIDAFISHNWCVPRWQKWFCLALHFNFRIAMVLTNFIASALGVLAVYGWFPVCRPEFATYPRAYVFRLTYLPLFLFLMCFYRDFLRCFPSWSPLVFLDKTCIHQEDKQLQRQGIEKLGAFLCYSQTMVILYTDMYLMKLWTVYEVASFMTVQSVEQMRVIPVFFPVVFMFSVMSLYVAGAIGLWAEMEFGTYYTAQVFTLVMCYGIMVVVRRWGRTKLEISRKMSTFSARSCSCLHEADRPLVYANIAALMRHTQGIGKGASEEAALACFDNLVRNHLSSALISSCGKYAMRYEHAVAIGFTFATPVFDQLAGLAYGMPLRHFCSYTLWYAVCVCFIVPAGFIGLSTWANTLLRITGWLEYVYLMFGLVIVFIPVTLTRQACDFLEGWANESNLGIVVFVIFFVISSVMARNAMDGPFRTEGREGDLVHAEGEDPAGCDQMAHAQTESEEVQRQSVKLDKVGETIGGVRLIEI